MVLFISLFQQEWNKVSLLHACFFLNMCYCCVFYSYHIWIRQISRTIRKIAPLSHPWNAQSGLLITPLTFLHINLCDVNMLQIKTKRSSHYVGSRVVRKFYTSSWLNGVWLCLFTKHIWIFPLFGNFRKVSRFFDIP